MEQGELIDKIVSDMYKKATDAKYEFNQFSVAWGPRSSDAYYTKKNRFDIRMCEFAKDCGVMSLGGSFYYFNGKIYEKIREEAVILAYDQLMMKLGIASDHATSVATRRAKFLDIILFYNQLKVRNDVVAFSNRVVDLRYAKGKDFGGTYVFHPKWHVVDYHPYPYMPDAKCPLFMRFLDEVLPDKASRDTLQMFLGLGLIQTADAFDEAKAGPRGTIEFCLILLGSGANGKSVLFNIMCALFGKHHITNVDYDTMTSDGDEGLRGRAVIRSAVFNWSSDSSAKKFCVKNTEMFKKIVSGEDYTFRLLGRDIETSKNCPYLIFNMNELPTMSETTRAMIRRLQYVSFDVTIPKYKQDPNLAYKIIKSELPGVFNWVLRGAREVRRRKYCFPTMDTSLKVKVRSMLPSNPVCAWMLTYGLRSEANAPGELSCLIRTDTMYECFKRFCENNDTDVISVNKFSRSLKNLNFMKHHKLDGSYCSCYGINETQLRTPMLIEMIRDGEDYHDYDKDDDSFIKED